MAAVEPCPGCGHPGGAAECLALFEAMIARDYSDPHFFGSHRLFVDVYCLQHPETRCVSAKSLAAHLVGLCLILEEGAGAAAGATFLRDWLDGSRALEKPKIPAKRGAMVLADLAGIDEPAAWRHAVRRWADSTWDAYEELQPLARRWAAEARAARR
ncbi:MAG: DUF5946 family protein [Allosphingosinicella sp.]